VRVRPHFPERYGPWALVAGGSLGMGAEYVRQLAALGLNVVVVADADHPPDDLAGECAAAHGVATRAVVADLAAPDVLDTLHRATDDLDLGLLVYNAAASHVGPFLEQGLESKLAIVDVNCRGPLLLVHAFAPGLVRRGRGGIVLMSSLSALQGTALVATYAASKAFDLVLAEGLWEELRQGGVDVLAVCPGATRTPFYEATRPRAGGLLAPPVGEPAAVVAEALAALGRGPRVIPGRANRFAAALLSRLLPRRAAAALMGRSMRAIYPAR
jgi:short-subunit dehydrogenase